MKRKLLFYFFAFIGFTASAQYDISVTNTDHQAAFIPGYTATYTVVVTNNGPGNATGIQVNNPIAAGITSFQWSGDNFSSGANVPLADTIDLLAGESVTYTILVAVPAAYVGPTLVSQATITTPAADLNPANDIATDTDIVPVGADIVVVKTDGSATYTAGNTVTYTITVENHGPAAATNVTAQDVLPALINPTTVSWSGDNGSSGTGALSDNIGNMAVGAAVVYTVTVPVPADFPQNQDLINTASAASSVTPDPNTECAGCTDTDTPDPKADLVTVKTNGQTEYVMGEDTVYTITITNNGPSDAENVVVTDNLPPATSQMSWTGSNGASGTGSLSDTVATLAAGATLTYTVTLGVPFGYNITVGNLTNTVTVASDTPDPVPACPACTDVDTPAPKWVTVDNTTYAVPNLVEDILIDSDCANVSNFSWQAGAGANSGIGFFKKNNSNFPLKDGVVIRCGNAKLCEGPFTDTNNSSTGSGASDTNSIGFPSSDGQDLHGVSESQGNPLSINDVSYIQFDFIPLTDNFSFNFLFASNEYGQYQCTFGDVFAFILKDQVTGTLQNLAVIPGTSTPISVTSIRDGAYNAGCGSVNAGFFGQYNLGTPSNAAISMRGQTIPMMASATVIPNHLYTIKLAIGDYIDSILDSAVFIEAGSFNVGGVDLGNDQLVSTGTAGCDGFTQTLDTQLDPSIWTFEWTQDGVLMPDTTPAITVSTAGQYCVTASNSTCQQTDCIDVEFRPVVIPISQAPSDLTECEEDSLLHTAHFDLSEIEPDMFGSLNPANYELYYYHNTIDAGFDANPILNFANYVGYDGEVVYVKVTEINSGYNCYSMFPFVLHVEVCGTATDPPDLVLCDDASNNGAENFDLTPQIPIVLGANVAADYTITIYTSQADADGGINPIPAGNLSAYPNATNPQILYVRMENNNDGTYSTVDFTLTVIATPTASISATPAVCSGDTGTVTFTGTAGATVTFDADGGPAQTIVLSASGTASLTTPALSAASTYTLHQVQVTPPTGCSQALSASATINVQALPTATISGTATICVGQSATITFTGTPGATVTYTRDGGAVQTILLNGSGTATINTGPLSASTTYDLVSVQDGTPLACQQTQSGSVTITVGGLPVASISGDTTICPGQTAVISFSGTPGATVTYTVDGGSNQTIALDASGNASLTTPALATQSIYSLVSVSTGGTPACQQNQVGTATVDVSPLPTASISGSATICPGDNATVTFTGTPNATVSYNADGGATQTVVLDASGNATVTLTGVAATTTLNLENVQLNPPTGCGQVQSGSVTITVAPLPVASISGDITICPNSSANVTFTGTPGATVSYNVDAGATQTVVLSAAGTALVNTGNISATTVFNLESVQSATAPNCAQNQSGSVTITVSPLPVAAISGDTTICPGDGASIAFTGTANATVSYNIGGGATQTITLDGSGNATLPTGALAASTTYNLVGVQDAAAPNCSQGQSGSVTITVSPLPVAAISGSATICSGSSANVTFTGTPGAAVSYNIDGGATQGVTLDAGGSATVSTGNITATTTFNLESVQAGTAPNCSQAQPGSVTITVLPLPVASISGDATICSGQSSAITFSGTPGATVQYTVNAGPAQSITLNASGTATLPTGALTGTTTYGLVDVTSATTPPCTQGQSGSATVTVLPLPTALVSGTIGVCQGDPAPEITFTGAGGTPPYVFSYNINGGATQTTPPSTGDTFIITAPTGTVGSFDYNLVSVQDAGGVGCSQPQTGTATVSVGAPPAIFTPSQIDVCDDNNDGFAHFDLTPAIAQVTGGNPGLTVSFYETLTDAQTGNSPIPDYTDYPNIDPGTQIVYVRAVDALTPGCPAVTTLTLQVNPVPVPNAAIDDYHLCDVNNPGDGQEAFTLQGWNLHVDGQPGMVFSYYHSLGAAQSGSGAIGDPYTNGSNPEQVWVRVEDPATGCFAVGTFNLVVDPLPAVTPAQINICGNATGIGESFDLTSVGLDVSGGIPGMAVSYYQNQSDALAGNTSTIADPQHFINTANPQTVFALVRNTATLCFNVTTVTLTVSQGPALGTPATLTECDDNNDGFATFDLTQAYMDIFGAATPPAGITATIHETMTDAMTGDTPIGPVTAYTNIDPTDQVVYVRAEYDATGCYSIVGLPLHVNPVPVGSDVAYPVCDDDLDGIGSFDLTTIEDDVLGGLDASLYTVSFYLTQAQAQAQSPAITNVLNFHNTIPNQQVIYAVVRDNATGCNDIVEVTLTVSPLPAVPVGGATPYTLCDQNNPGDQQEEFDLSSQITGILAGQSGIDVSFYVSQADAQVPQSPLPMLYTNLAGSNPQTIWVRLENTTTHCVAYTTLDLRVAPLPVLIPPMDPVVECDPDGDGFAPFDLQGLVPDMLQSATGIDVSFHETMTDAQAGVGALANPYTNIVAFDQVVYVRAEDTATGCVSVMALPIKVIPSPQLPPLSPDHDLVMCDQDANNQSGTTVFDLTQNEGYILGLQSGPASAYTITYYTSQAGADSGTAGGIIPASSYTNTSNPQTIWVRIEGVGTDCYNVSSFQISVNTPLALTHPANLNLCDDGPTSAIPQTVFDLRVKEAEILNGASPVDYTFTWYASMADYQANLPIADPSAYTNVANPQTVVAQVTSPQGCRSFTTLTIRVIPLPDPRTTNLPYPQYEACDENLPVGTEAFDLTLNETYIRNNDPDLVFEYYDNLAGAQSGVGVITDAASHQTATGTIYIRVVRNLEQDLNGQYCAVIIPIQVVVNPLPDLQPAADTQCGAGTSQSGTFTLSGYNDDVMVSGDTTGYSFAYFPDLASAQGGTGQLADTYTTTSNPQVITVRVTNDATGCVNYTTLTLGVQAGAIAASPAGFAQCGVDAYGFLDVDLTQFDTEVLSGQDPASFSVAYFATQGDATAGTSPLTSPFNTTSATLWAVVTNAATGCRSVAVPVSILIEPLVTPVIDNTSNTICVEWGTGVLLSGLTLHSDFSGNAGYTLEWFYQGQSVGVGDTYTISDPLAFGDYTVVATSTSALGCVSQVSQVFNVVRSGPAVAAAGTIGYSVSDAFDGGQTITVSVEGYGAGTYYYQLDNGPILDNGGVFTNVPPCSQLEPGVCDHQVTIYDYAGIGDEHCDPLVIGDIHSIDYPRFFTPNGDGINDQWNITGLADDQNSKIYIFDRYGKLLKQIKPGVPSQGWDGTLNGEPLPSTDYWFVVYYTENGAQKEFKAHFSLKR